MEALEGVQGLAAHFDHVRLEDLLHGVCNCQGVLQGLHVALRFLRALKEFLAEHRLVQLTREYVLDERKLFFDPPDLVDCRGGQAQPRRGGVLLRPGRSELGPQAERLHVRAF